MTETRTPPVYTLSLHDALPILDDEKSLEIDLIRYLDLYAKDFVLDTLWHGLEDLQAKLPDQVTPALLKKRSEEHTSELQSRGHLVCRLLLEKKHITDFIA